MTPKEKAKELVDKFIPNCMERIDTSFNKKYYAKQCALIAVDREYDAKIEAYNEMSEFCPDIAGQAAFYADKEREAVKQEIEKL